MKKYLFTSESVTEGHPDKICDKISDYILDEALRQDKTSKMAVEATIKDDLILIYGEASTKAKLDYEKLAKEVLKDIGYNEEYHVIVKVGMQSKEINKAVEKDTIMAGDQGIMFGYATNETKELMPMPIMLANKLAYNLTKVRKEDKDSPLLPDGKTEVTVEYQDDIPKRIDTIIIASQHKKEVSSKELRKYIIEKVINKVVPSNLIDDKTNILINTSGSFTVGGSFGDSGTTGRKIVCDTYGGMGKVGGGCFSSKDPSKVDRSAAYYARYVAKNIVAHNYAVARNAAHEAVLHAVSQAKQLADGDVWIEGAAQCRLPIESSSCLISFTAAGLAGFLPEYWNPLTDRFGQPRWKVLVRNKTSYVFGEIGDAEIEAMQQVTKNSYSTSVCRASQASGILCVPSLFDTVNDSLASLELP